MTAPIHLIQLTYKYTFNTIAYKRLLTKSCKRCCNFQTSTIVREAFDNARIFFPQIHRFTYLAFLTFKDNLSTNLVKWYHSPVYQGRNKDRDIEGEGCRDVARIFRATCDESWTGCAATRMEGSPGIKQTYKEELMRTRVWRGVAWRGAVQRVSRATWIMDGADKTAPAIYRQWASPSSRITLRFLPSFHLRFPSSVTFHRDSESPFRNIEDMVARGGAQSTKPGKENNWRRNK